SNTLSWTYDTVSPSVTLTGGGSGTTNTATYSVTATFSEDVSGFVLGDVSATNATLGNFQTTNAHTYTFDVMASGQGLVSVNVGAGVAADGASNPNTAPNTLSWTYDSVSPTVTLTVGLHGSTTISTYSVTATFSEDVSGFVVGDVSATNATVGNFQSSDAHTYSFDVTASGQGLVSVNVGAGVAADA